MTSSSGTRFAHNRSETNRYKVGKLRLQMTTSSFRDCQVSATTSKLRGKNYFWWNWSDSNNIKNKQKTNGVKSPFIAFLSNECKCELSPSRFSLYDENPLNLNSYTYSGPWRVDGVHSDSCPRVWTTVCPCDLLSLSRHGGQRVSHCLPAAMRRANSMTQYSPR